MGTVVDHLRELQQTVNDTHQKADKIQRELDDIRNHLKQLEEEINETERP